MKRRPPIKTTTISFGCCPYCAERCKAALDEIDVFAYQLCPHSLLLRLPEDEAIEVIEEETGFRLRTEPNQKASFIILK